MVERELDSGSQGERDAVVCAWCARPIREGNSGSISHGSLEVRCMGVHPRYAILVSARVHKHPTVQTWRAEKCRTRYTRVRPWGVPKRTWS